MRTRNALERLAAVAPQDPLADVGEEDRILARILATPRPAASRRRPVVLALAGVAVLAATAVGAAVELGHGNRPVAGKGGQQHVVLSGARIQMAGYHFRTPAGFKASANACAPASSSSAAVTVLNGFAAAASVDGGCIEAFLMVSHSGTPSDHGAESVAVGNYEGYFVSQDASGQSALYVRLPAVSANLSQYLALYAEGLTEQQLIAIAVSGLPTLPIFPSTTTATETTG